MRLDKSCFEKGEVKICTALIPHGQFLSFVRKMLARYYSSSERREEIRHLRPMIVKILSEGPREAQDPASMFRSLLSGFKE